MNKIKLCCIVLLAAATNGAFALDLNTVFDNQKKAAFPDTCEMKMRTTVALPRVNPQVVNTTVITAGESKSITTVKSSMTQMKIVQNGQLMKVTDLKTGKALPSQTMPRQNPADFSRQMGTPADYNAAVKVDSLWKISPKDPAKPTLYYSSKQRRIVKMTAVVNGAVAESEFEYCDNSCDLPGTLKKAVITTQLPSGDESIVTMDIFFAKERRRLPAKMFELE